MDLNILQKVSIFVNEQEERGPLASIRNGSALMCRSDILPISSTFIDPNVSYLNSVQHECIPTALLGQDIICQAKSGMGKTAVFVLATLQRLEPVAGEVHVVVLCHTRELAFQIQKEYERFSKYLPEVKSRVFYGGPREDIPVIIP